MDPITVGVMMGAGAIAQGVGSYFNYEAAQGQAEAQREVAAANARIADFEKKIEAQKFRAMELDANRRSMESIRAGMRARSMGLVAATSQGAGGGSGLQGGYGSIAGQLGTSLVGISQNLEIGRNIFGFNTGISGEKINIANAQARAAEYGSQAALGQGISSFGSSMMSAAPAAGRLVGNFSGGPAPVGVGAYNYAQGGF